MYVGLDIQEAMEQGEMDVDLQGGPLQPRPDVVPRQVPLTRSTKGVGKVQVSYL
jgi:hypothetical protein